MLKIPTKNLWGARKIATYPKSGLGRLTAVTPATGSCWHFVMMTYAFVRHVLFVSCVLVIVLMGSDLTLAAHQSKFRGSSPGRACPTSAVFDTAESTVTGSQDEGDI